MDVPVDAGWTDLSILLTPRPNESVHAWYPTKTGGREEHAGLVKNKEIGPALIAEIDKIARGQRTAPLLVARSNGSEVVAHLVEYQGKGEVANGEVRPHGYVVRTLRFPCSHVATTAAPERHGAISTAPASRLGLRSTGIFVIASLVVMLATVGLASHAIDALGVVVAEHLDTAAIAARVRVEEIGKNIDAKRVGQSVDGKAVGESVDTSSLKGMRSDFMAEATMHTLATTGAQALASDHNLDALAERLDGLAKKRGEWTKEDRDALNELASLRATLRAHMENEAKFRDRVWKKLELDRD